MRGDGPYRTPPPKPLGIWAKYGSEIIFLLLLFPGLPLVLVLLAQCF